MKVLVIGSGGREHALVWKLSKSKKVGTIYCIPGNGGISDLADCVDIDTNDTEALIRFSRKERVELTIIGPESHLAAGVVDAFEEKGMMVFGPRKDGALIETSKAYAKELMQKSAIPTAYFRTFSNYTEAADYLTSLEPPYVIKADGLCAGKGAYIIKDQVEGMNVLGNLMVSLIYGDAGKKVVIESFLPGIEASYLVFTDGTSILPMLPSQDHKPLLDNDEGPNTGGMGAYAPIPFLSDDVKEQINDTIILPTVNALRNEGVLYKGVLYGGLMLLKEKPYVIEFNARFGDPETQPILFTMESDLTPVLLACVNGKLNEIKEISWRKGVSVCVVMASRGYPDNPQKGNIINGLESIKGQKDVMVFHAGTKKVGKDYYTSGGRVLGVTAIGSNYADAIKKAYQAVAAIEFEGMQYRKDIGQKALQIKL